MHLKPQEDQEPNRVWAFFKGELRKGHPYTTVLGLMIFLFTVARVSMLIVPIGIGWVQTDLMGISVWFLGWFVLFRLLNPFATYLELQCGVWLMTQIFFDLYVKSAKELLQQSAFSMNKKSAGERATEMDQALASCRFLISVVLNRVLPVITEVISAMIFVGWKFGWQFSCAFGALCFVYVCILKSINQKKSKDAYQNSLNAQKKRNAILFKSLDAFEFVKSQKLEEQTLSRLSEQAMQEFWNLRKTLQSRGFQESVERLVISVLNAVLFVSLVVIGQYEVLDAAQIVLLLFLFQQTIMPVGGMTWIFVEIPLHKQTLHNFFALKPFPHTVVQYNKEVKPEDDANIVFEDIAIAFGSTGATEKDSSGQGVQIETGFNMTFDTIKVPKGSNVCIYGPIGSGKSMLFKALMGQVPSTGVVRGIEAQELVHVHQEPKIMAESLDNFFAFAFEAKMNKAQKSSSIAPPQKMRLGMRALFGAAPIEATHETKRLTQAQRDHVWSVLETISPDSIERLKQAWFDPFEEQTLPFSGGQKVVLLLVFAIVQEPKLLLLDEVTGALDPETEQRVYQTLKAQLPESTKLFVTHRLTGLPTMDYYIGLNQQRVAYQGCEPDDLFKTLIKQQEKEK